MSTNTPNQTESPEAGWILRILTGPQAGAALDLKATRYRIGSDEGCDIVLTGETIEPHHLEVFFADGQLSLIRAAGPVFVDGAPLTDTPADLAPLHLIALGDVVLSYGPADSAWPTEEDALSRAKPAATEFVDDSAEGAAAALVPDSNRPAQKPALRHLRRLVLAGGGLGACVLAVMTGLLLTGPSEIIHPAVARETRAHQLQTLSMTLRKDPDLQNVHLKAGDNNGKQLAGYVDRKTTLARLNTLAQQDSVSINIVSLEQVRESLDVLLDLHGLVIDHTLTADPEKGVVLDIRGIINMPELMGGFTAVLHDEIPAIDHINANVVTWDEVSRQLEDFRRSGLQFDQIRFDIKDNRLMATGSLVGDFAGDFKQNLQDILNGLPVAVPVTDQVLVGPSFNGKVESVLIGPSSAVRIHFESTGESRLYDEGSRLPDGYQLRRIERDRLILASHNNEFTYPVTLKTGRGGNAA